MEIPYGTFRHSAGGSVALIAAVLVFISCRAVGNLLNLVPAERRGLREKSPEVL